MSKPTPVTLNQPALGSKDWGSPLNTNFQDIEDELNSHDRPGGPFFAHEQSNPDMSVRVDPGFAWAGGSLTEKSAQDTNNFTAPNNDDRIDRVVTDADTGDISMVSGSESSSPSPPSIPEGKMPCAQIYLTPSTSEITNSEITDERAYSYGSKLDDLERNLTVTASEINSHLDTLSGRIIIYGGENEPSGWLQCNGQEVSRSTYSDLFNVIGTAFGNGDGSSTFNVPDLRDRTPIGDRKMGSSDAGRVDNYTTDRGYTGGEDKHQLTVNELASHGHTLGGNDGEALNQTLGPDYASDGVDEFTSNDPIQNTGGDAAHNNMQPFQVFYFLIKT